jgi:hypothetical protein
MPTQRRPADLTQDLFASLPTARAPDAAKRPRAPHAEPSPDELASRPRHLLPKDLAGALERLNDAEVDSLLAAVTAEARRRGRLAPSSQAENPTADATPRARMRVAVDRADPSLTTGKLNAVRAAFKAGVRPSAIARQFGISQSDVKRALAAQKSRR